MQTKTKTPQINGYKVREMTTQELVKELLELPYWQGIAKLSTGYLPQFSTNNDYVVEELTIQEMVKELLKLPYWQAPSWFLTSIQLREHS